MAGIPRSEAVVFDIFDTLVVRPFADPKDLFKLIETRHNAPGFAKARRKSEAEARDTVHREINIDELYLLMPAEFRHLKQVEIDLEISCCRADKACLELFNEMKSEGRKVFIASDMYLGQKTIETILRSCGYEGWDGLFVSCDERTSKNSGRLYTRISETTGIPLKDMVMIGDNEHSDIEMAQRSGMMASWWKPLWTRYAETHKREMSIAIKHPEASSLVGMDMLLWQEHPEDDDYWHSIGMRFGGPMAASFSVLINDTVPENVRKILFFARDGYVPYIVYRELFPDDDRTDYLHTSRLISKCFRSKHPENDRDETLSILTYLDDTGRSEALGIPADMGMGERMKLLESKEEEVKGILLEGRNNYITYLRKISGGEGEAYLVDTTTKNFTSQRIINDCVPELKTTGIYYAVTGKWDLPQVIYCDRRRQHLSSTYVNLAETFFAASAKPVRDYDQDGNPVFPIPLSGNEVVRAGFAESLFKGELEYARMFRSIWNGTLPFIDGKVMDMWLDVLIEDEWKNRKDGSRLGGMAWFVDSRHKRTLHTILRPSDIVKTVLWKGMSLLFKLGIRR